MDMFNFGGMFNGMFKQVPNGNVKIAANGKMAIKTTTGYKTFDVKKMKLTNCDNFAFDMPNMFWVIPTMKVVPGDVILVNGKPRAVIEVKDNTAKTFSFDDSTIAETVFERHVFMGKTYCYGKIWSPFSGLGKSDGAMSSMMSMMMMSQMFGGNSNGGMNTNGFNPMMFMLMSGKDNMFSNLFDGAFDFGSVDALADEMTEDKED